MSWKKRPVVPLDEGDPMKGSTVRLPIKLWDQISEALDFEKELRHAAKFPGAFTLSDLMQDFVEWALEAYWMEQGGKPKGHADLKPSIQRALKLRREAAEQAAREEEGSEQH